jgi:hypothetical protein
MSCHYVAWDEEEVGWKARQKSNLPNCPKRVRRGGRFFLAILHRARSQVEYEATGCSGRSIITSCAVCHCDSLAQATDARADTDEWMSTKFARRLRRG